MADKETIIGEGIRVSGEIRGDEDLRVRGRVDGKIQITQKVTVDQGGIVEADVDARDLIVAGTVVGNIVASESVKLAATARVVGNLASPRVSMEAGAAYRGRVDMGDIAAARAVVAARPTTARSAQSEQSDRGAPPRLSVPARTASVPTKTIPRLGTPATLVKTASVAPVSPPSVPPAMPRVAGATTGAPAWAKKKIKRR